MRSPWQRRPSRLPRRFSPCSLSPFNLAAMPCTATVDSALRLGMVRAAGRVTGHDLLKANEALYSHPAWEPGFDELWDCIHITEFVVDLDEIQAVADMEVEGRDRVGQGRVALAITRSVVEMIGDLYKALVEEGDRSIEVVRTVGAGAGWLGLEAVPSWMTRSR